MANAHVRLAEESTDLRGTIRLLDVAVVLYRRVLRQTPDAEDAAVNLELALLSRADAQAELDRASEAAMSYKKDAEPPDPDDGQVSEQDDDAGAFNTRTPDAEEGGVLPPTESPEDILDRQAELRERRNPNSARPRKRVRTDW